jgi:hypothetical protein
MSETVIDVLLQLTVTGQRSSPDHVMHVVTAVGEQAVASLGEIWLPLGAQFWAM